MHTTLDASASVVHPSPLSEDVCRMALEIRQTLTDDPPSIPSKYFYDDRGSALFEQITQVPEYYQTRTEERLLEQVAPEIMGFVAPAELIELGSGAGRKIRTLLDLLARERRGRDARVTLVDINARCVAESCAALSADYPGIAVVGAVSDFERERPRQDRLGRRLMVLFAGTIGNLHPDDVPGFLKQVGRGLDEGDGFLVGVDLVKDKGRLEAAYNDARGVTAAFNLNVLRALNERLGADFDLAAFEHVAFFDEAHEWIEMRVRAKRPLRVTIPASRLVLDIERGDEIRTELSCKYTLRSFDALLTESGFALRRWYTDPEALFALALLERTP
jgi:L-histidine N-alpha-methyltransferase